MCFRPRNLIFTLSQYSLDIINVVWGNSHNATRTTNKQMQLMQHKKAQTNSQTPNCPMGCWNPFGPTGLWHCQYRGFFICIIYHQYSPLFPSECHLSIIFVCKSCYDNVLLFMLLFDVLKQSVRNVTNQLPQWCIWGDWSMTLLINCSSLLTKT